MFVCRYLFNYRFKKIILTARSLFVIKRRYSYLKMVEDELKKQKLDPSLLLPPDCVRGMKVLERNMFDKIIIVPWIALNENNVSAAVSYLKRYFLKLLKFKPLQPASIKLDGEEMLGSNFEENVSQGLGKRVFLNPSLVSVYTDISEEDQIKLKNVNITESSLHYSKITLRYSNWRADEILTAILPRDDSFTSYSIIGHITHVNIRDHLLSYKAVIGQVLLDKVSGCKTVVNKTDIIDSTYRNFKMEVLCGENNFITQTRQNNCVFELDFSSVYWNPRLCTEHERIVQKLKSGDILYDVFAGIGPFAILAAKKKCHVLANDLNPASCKWLEKNRKLNKVNTFLQIFNKDGKLFLQKDVKEDMLEKWKNKEFKGKAMHITMNLPAMAVSFLPVFVGMFKGEGISNVRSLPIVHVYCFVKGDERTEQATKLVEDSLQASLGEHLLEVSFVRNVSSKKDMMRVSFKLWRELLEGCTSSSTRSSEDNNGSRKLSLVESDEPQQKRICLHIDGGSDGEAQRDQQEQAQ